MCRLAPISSDVKQRGEPKCEVIVWAVAARAATMRTVLDKYLASERHGMAKSHLKDCCATSGSSASRLAASLSGVGQRGETKCRGSGFGLCTTRDSTLSYFGLAADLPLASHDRDELMRYCACALVAFQRSWMCFEQLSEPKCEAVVLAPASSETTF